MTVNEERENMYVISVRRPNFKLRLSIRPEFNFLIYFLITLMLNPEKLPHKTLST